MSTSLDTSRVSEHAARNAAWERRHLAGQRPATRAVTVLGCLLGLALLIPADLQSRPAKKQRDTLDISLNPTTRKIVLSWTGDGVLKQASSPNGRYKPVTKRSARHGKTSVMEIDPMSVQGVYGIGNGGSGPIYSGNVVGYVNVTLPPGLSLLANPLAHPDNTLAAWFPAVPDGSQVYKLGAGGTYEVSTFDAIAGGWSNPDLDISVGTGFYFLNPSAQTLTVTFIGEVWFGTLVSPLPAGISTQGALVPQAGSINTVHRIPGIPGDEISIFTNDLHGGGTYEISVYTEEEGWVPDLTLGVAQGFWIQKQQAQDWVRVFSIN